MTVPSSSVPSAAPGEPGYALTGPAMRERYMAAPDFEAYLATVEKNRELWHGLYERARPAAEPVEAARRLDEPVYLLALSEDWCGDAVNALPVVARWVEQAPNLHLRVLDRDENPDIMDAHLTDGRSRSIPIVIVFDSEFNELGWWGPRPKALQEWVLGPGQELDKDARYLEVRKWYVRDRGRTLLAEIMDHIEPAVGAARPDPS